MAADTSNLCLLALLAVAPAPCRAPVAAPRWCATFRATGKRVLLVATSGLEVSRKPRMWIDLGRRQPRAHLGSAKASSSPINAIRASPRGGRVSIRRRRERSRGAAGGRGCTWVTSVGPRSGPTTRPNLENAGRLNVEAGLWPHDTPATSDHRPAVSPWATATAQLADGDLVAAVYTAGLAGAGRDPVPELEGVEGSEESAVGSRVVGIRRDSAAGTGRTRRSDTRRGRPAVPRGTISA